jgi:hypothetical protein
LIRFEKIVNKQESEEDREYKKRRLEIDERKVAVDEKKEANMQRMLELIASQLGKINGINANAME